MAINFTREDYLNFDADLYDDETMTEEQIHDTLITMFGDEQSIAEGFEGEMDGLND